MDLTNGKMSIRQAICLLLLGLGAPSLRVIPNYVSIYSKQASWITPIIASLLTILLIYTWANLFNKTKKASLYEVYKMIFGNIVCNIITVVYLIWTIALTSLYLRMYGERVLGAILFNANLPAILAIMCVLIYFVINQRIDGLGRSSEILLTVLLFIFITAFIFVFPNIKPENIYPVTYYDTLPVLKGSFPILSLMSYITIITILGDKISDKQNIKKIGVKYILFFAFLLIMLILVTVGLFGYRMAEQFIFPYFSTLKSIKIMESIERVESLVISTWISSDFAIITLFSIASLTLIQKLFKMKSYGKISFWFILFIFLFTISLTVNVYEIEYWTRIVAVPVNVILFWGIPILSLIVGKFRKVV